MATITEISAYKASDGRIFENQLEAQSYQNALNQANKIADIKTYIFQEVQDIPAYTNVISNQIASQAILDLFFESYNKASEISATVAEMFEDDSSDSIIPLD